VYLLSLGRTLSSTWR